MIPKTVEPASYLSSASTHTRTCRVCSATTREGKPFCPDHVVDNPYVQSILHTMATRRAEEDEVRKRGADAVNIGGLTAKELVLHQSLHGARTVERLSRELQLDAAVLKGYVRALTNTGQIAVGRTNRGSTIVRLID
jgi:hypothetical protein